MRGGKERGEREYERVKGMRERERNGGGEIEGRGKERGEME